MTFHMEPQNQGFLKGISSSNALFSSEPFIKIQGCNTLRYFKLQDSCSGCSFLVTNLEDGLLASSWLGSKTMHFIFHKKAIWKGSYNRILRGLAITMVINHLQVSG